MHRRYSYVVFLRFRIGLCTPSGILTRALHCLSRVETVRIGEGRRHADCESLGAYLCVLQEEVSVLSSLAEPDSGRHVAHLGIDGNIGRWKSHRSLHEAGNTHRLGPPL